jgi:DNA repair protein RadC
MQNQQLPSTSSTPVLGLGYSTAAQKGDLPREKLLRGGARSLSDEELLRVILGSGVKGTPIARLSRSLLERLDSNGLEIEASEIMKLVGMGQAKACLILAALEFARRRIHPHGLKIRAALDVFPLLSYLGDRKQEHFLCISLNGAHEVLHSRIVTVGLLSSCQVHPREVLSDPITDRAAAIIIAHNHPSGDLTPSEADLQITKRLQSAAELLGIRLLDHIIFSARDFMSLMETGKMDKL